MRPILIGATLFAIACSSSGSGFPPDVGGPAIDSDARGRPDAGIPDATITPDASVVSLDAGIPGALPAGWLYTAGDKIYVADGQGGGTQWMGRGVNLDDLYLCGYNYMLETSSAESSLETVIAGLMRDWKPNFVRISLGMDSYPTVVSWLANAGQYRTPMTMAINAIGANPGVHVLVTLRSDASMIGQDTGDGDAEATGLPSDSASTPSASMFPSGTDATYVALVDTFATAGFVLFGLTNEPGGDTLTDEEIAAAMTHAVATIRAEEDRLGVPHHVVSVQGNLWTSNVAYYATHPIAADNVVYEVHGYPPIMASYTYPGQLPVILGEYGSLTDSTSFYADVEAKQIPNMAWDFEPYSDCAPDLLTVTDDASTLTPTAWGMTVQMYLTMHAGH